jgi:hypothetical protein
MRIDAAMSYIIVEQPRWPTFRWLLNEIKIYVATVFIFGVSSLFACALVVSIKAAPAGASVLAASLFCAAIIFGAKSVVRANRAFFAHARK